MQVSQKALDQRILYRDQFTEFAKDCLVIRTKSGSVTPFILNKAQQHLHDKIEEQKQATGKVRAIILKGRQQGCSTYVEGRFYHNTIHRFGVRTFILAHDRASTGSIYEMAQRYHENCPAALKPNTGTSNAKELIFDKLDSGYKIGTAGTDTIGRGQTLQYFHGSEVAFWPSRSEGEMSKGILQAVGDIDNTEIILESTANGIGGYYHSEVQKAIRGEGDYILVFIPWYWQEEYRRPQPIDFEATEYENEIMDEYSLDPEQMMWRRNKVIELTTALQDGMKAFKQEYPNNINEAFQTSSEGSMIKPELVHKARKAQVAPGNTLIVGVDPSRGGDRFSVIRRKARVMYRPESHTGDINLGKAVQICKKVLDEEKPKRMFVDAGGGADLVDRLHELGYRRIVKAVAFGGAALSPERYRNKRCEMWGKMHEWLADDELSVQIPDEDALESDLCSPKAHYDSMDRLCMESKDDIKKRGMPSPDIGDAAALTFAEQVIDYDETYAQPDQSIYE